MKQRIRLTESQLHDVIRKCVNEAINEMDPRTYASYADKREAQGKHDKAREGRQMAAQAWNKKYGQPTTKHTKYDDGEESEFSFSELSPMDNGYERQSHSQRTSRMPGQSYMNQSMADNTTSFYSNGDVTNMSCDQNNKRSFNPNHNFNYDEGSKVAHQMATGTGKYTKGKGWQ